MFHVMLRGSGKETTIIDTAWFVIKSLVVLGLAIDSDDRNNSPFFIKWIPPLLPKLNTLSKDMTLRTCCQSDELRKCCRR